MTSNGRLPFNTPSEDLPSEDFPSEDSPSEDSSSEDLPSEDSPSEDSPFPLPSRSVQTLPRRQKHHFPKK